MAIEGPVIRWVADHRKHHAFSDRQGDPHSPWRYGETVPALVKGLWWAHAGWLFDREHTPRDKYAPDLMADRDLVRVEKAFPAIVLFSTLAPAVIGGLWSMSWQGALTAFFWASLLRIGLLHHVTWSINSICHAIGERPFHSRDRSANVWWLAVLSMGESWHNLHHADPTCARHGVDRGQLDSSARLIWAVRTAGLGQQRALAARARGSPPARGGVRTALVETRDARHGRRARTTARHRRTPWAEWHGDCSPGQGRVNHLAVPDDGQGASRAADRRRPEAVRRQGIRGDHRRGDRHPGRRLQAGRLRALRRQGGPVRRRRRPRDPRPAGRDHRRAVDRGARPGAARAGGDGPAGLHRELHRRVPHPRPRLPHRDSHRLVRLADQRRREPGRAPARRGVQAA